MIRPDNEHAPQSRLLCLENTLNRGGGAILPYNDVEAMTQLAGQHNMATHLDGARLFNAVVASGIPAEKWSGHFDTVSVCFSKGLGAPVGSALAGPADLIHAMRRQRKVLGGGMRQSGIIAAGAIYALQNNIDRLADDHAAAAEIADAVARTEGLSLDPSNVDTNIVIYRVDSQVANASEFCAAAHERGVWLLPFSQVHVRAVTHLHISRDDAKTAGQIIGEVANQLADAASAKPGGRSSG